jgi:cytochrome c-type biogenesis protein
MTDVSLAGAFLAGLISFLSPCVLPLVPGYISMLSGIGMEQLRQGQAPRSGLFASALAFVFGFSAVFITFGASASAVGGFLGQHRTTLAPIAGALILLFGLHLLGVLIKLTVRVGIILGVVLAILGVIALVHGGALFAGLRAVHFFSLSVIGFFGPAMTRWLNRDVHLRSGGKQPGIWSGFLLGFAFAFGWTPCIGPILAAILAIAASESTVAKGAGMLAVYSLGLGVPFIVAALAVEPFAAFLVRFRAHLGLVEKAMGGLLVLTGIAFLTGVVGEASNWLLSTFPALGKIG